MKTHILAAASGLALCAFLAAAPAYAQAARTNANGMPTNDSTPAEKAETARINVQEGVTTVGPSPAAAAQADVNNAQYQAQQQQYQNQLQENQAAQQKYQDRTVAYQTLRTRYAAERAAYHRGIWPDRYVKWVVVRRDANLIGERVQLITGNRVGTVIDTAHATNGNVDALLVRMDDDKIVWIDSQDVRYNRADGIVMTNLDASDLRHMSDERL
jgi:uncharacterized protein YeaO (DUF488 family)